MGGSNASDTWQVDIPLEIPLHIPPASPPTSFLQQASVVRFRLRRWPPARLLWGDADNLRLARLLLSHPLDLQRLMQSSQVAADKCVSFVTRMAAADLLELERR